MDRPQNYQNQGTNLPEYVNLPVSFCPPILNAIETISSLGQFTLYSDCFLPFHDLSILVHETGDLTARQAFRLEGQQVMVQELWLARQGQAVEVCRGDPGEWGLGSTDNLATSGSRAQGLP